MFFCLKDPHPDNGNVTKHGTNYSNLIQSFGRRKQINRNKERHHL